LTLPNIAYCFQESLDADYLRTHFGGEVVDPKNLGAWSRPTCHSPEPHYTL